MKYIVTQKQKAIDLGINPVGHYKKDDKIILNENEVMHNALLEGNIEERVKALGAKIYTPVYTKRMIKLENYVV